MERDEKTYHDPETTGLSVADDLAEAVPGEANSSSSKGKTPEVIERDSTYFIESLFMVFQVQNCLFRVPTYLLSAESQVFSGMFHLPQAGDLDNPDNVEGLSVTKPIILPNEYLKEDFRSLLKALYPLSFNITVDLSKSEWISVLKLSTMWYFIKLRNAAISELAHSGVLDSIEMVTLGRKYRISSWITGGFVRLIERYDSITDDEAIDIDSTYVTTAYKLYRMREDRIKNRWNVSDVEVVFGPELQAIRQDEEGYKTPELEIEFRPETPQLEIEVQAEANPLPEPTAIGRKSVGYKRRK
ncbi:hypothetical protein JR316_0002636 [Psilocybe cubensis]|uniref:Uncharacterized protein n=2 Tax=Psilocybe cubensis TaxID=181762 RepID=A0ACB8HDI6_PSICU|nr:hypothetical protein JR316_0002636 [Psilocybe cubensis]KAH9485722.1 hypothetical protein JR316_0002636 [Psilocybe cubensis]